MILLKVLGRVFGGFFGGIGRGFLGLFRWIGRHEMFLGIATVLVVVVGGLWLLLSLLDVNVVFGKPQAVVASLASSQPAPSPTAVPATTPTALPVSRSNAPQATEAFMVGQVNGNADQVWDALTATFHTQLAGSGRDKTYFQRFFEAQKKNGIGYESYQYIGGVPADASGNSIHFYIGTLINNDHKTARVPWTFVLDKDGKIANVDFPQ